MSEEWQAQERRYQSNSSLRTFTKIEIPSWQDIAGITQHPWMSRQRLENEYAVLTYIGKMTNIPVPRPYSLESVDGCLTLTTEWIDGVPFDDLDPGIRSETYLDQYVRSFILPELGALTSHISGTLKGTVIPPRRVFERFPGQWVPQTSGEIFHFTHNDLSQHNFLCNPTTGKVMAVIDWEFAGFYPTYFEAPFWTKPFIEIEDEEEEVERLLKFLGPSPPESER
ncbi:uncharacterized protein HMPREF1541_10624 [Cyphellophora europaea CBS 101466]|uniref:Aminoglycoside phosphotransferase domain-containing protein n=1 Tax=Cyphellophora europaea (strain CBS 101466) TaxID=1220924 RepID=W2S8V1_CYPE1|nr:uncharacterized protein HMPREF1541_10624 [Cyphellophora europaea CBS 101466]ETN44443.1 hypothetical protein HMPREF1541_10624 [Cyphellophora europaea CBS 101466]